MFKALICIVLLFQITCLADIEGDCQQGDEYPTVFELYKAAEHGDPNAQFKLGNMYMNGEEIEQNGVEAVKWLTKAALQGHDTAQNNLGFMYYTGSGVEANRLEAIKWLKKAAKQGSTIDHEMLVDACCGYNGLSQDYFKVRKLAFQSANKGDVFFQSRLADKYLFGNGVPQNYSKALKWHLKAAKKGSLDKDRVLYFHNIIYNKIYGALKCYDFVEAYKWFLIAEKSNIEIEKTDEIKDEQLKKMLPQYIQQAITRAEQFIKSGDVNDLAESPTPTYGTAFLVSSKGHMLTAFDVIKKAVRINVILEGETYPARIIYSNQRDDLALLKTAITKDEYLKITKFDYNVRSVTYADYNFNAKIGDKVFTVGFFCTGDKSEEQICIEGNISDLSIPMCIKEDTHFYKLNIPIRSGNIGGPLINEDGDVIGSIASRPDLSTLTPILNGLVDPNTTYGVQGLTMSMFVTGKIEAEMKEAGNQDNANEKTFSIEDVKKAVGLVVCY